MTPKLAWAAAGAAIAGAAVAGAAVAEEAGVCQVELQGDLGDKDDNDPEPNTKTYTLTPSN